MNSTAPSTWVRTVIRVAKPLCVSIALLGGVVSAVAQTPPFTPPFKSTDQRLMIFVTSKTTTGRFNPPPGSKTPPGPLAAQEMCQSLATNAGLKGSWYPLISTSTFNAIDLIGTTGKGAVYNAKGQIVAANRAELWKGNLKNMLIYTESGTPVVTIGSNAIFTGTQNNGWKYSTSGRQDYCDDWSGGSLTTLTGQGQATRAWMSNLRSYCNTSARYYCVGVFAGPDEPTPLPTESPTASPTVTPSVTPIVNDPNPPFRSPFVDNEEALTIFATGTLFTGRLNPPRGSKTAPGARAAQEVCASSARQAGLTGSWYPLISTSNWDASSITGFRGNSPIYNTKGEIIALSRSAFWNQQILRPVLYTEYGSPAGYSGYSDLFTGTNEGGLRWGGTTRANYCDDWSSSTGQTIVGNTNSNKLISNKRAGCNIYGRILCIGNYTPPGAKPLPTSTPTVTPTVDIPPQPIRTNTPTRTPTVTPTTRGSKATDTPTSTPTITPTPRKGQDLPTSTPTVTPTTKHGGGGGGGTQPCVTTDPQVFCSKVTTAATPSSNGDVFKNGNVRIPIPLGDGVTAFLNTQTGTDAVPNEGFGQRVTFLAKIRARSDGALEITRGNGNSEVFISQAGGYRSITYYQGDLRSVQPMSDRIRVSSPDGSYEVFSHRVNDALFLTESVTARGARTTYALKANSPLLTTITYPDLSKIQFGFSGDKVMSVTGVSGLTYQLGYSKNNLTSVTAPDGTQLVRLTYDKAYQELPVSYLDRDGVQTLYSYDREHASAQPILRAVSMNGAIDTYERTATSTTRRGPQKSSTIYSFAQNAALRDVYPAKIEENGEVVSLTTLGSKGEVLSTTSEDGEKVTYSYGSGDAQSPLPLSISSSTGLSVSYQRNPNLAFVVTEEARKDSSGGVITIRSTWLDSKRPKSVQIYRDGVLTRETKMTYYPTGLDPIEVTEREITTFETNATNVITGATLPDGSRHSWSFAQDGTVTSLTKNGIKTTFDLQSSPQGGRTLTVISPDKREVLTTNSTSLQESRSLQTQRLNRDGTAGWGGFTSQSANMIVRADGGMDNSCSSDIRGIQQCTGTTTCNDDGMGCGESVSENCLDFKYSSPPTPTPTVPPTPTITPTATITPTPTPVCGSQQSSGGGRYTEISHTFPPQAGYVDFEFDAWSVPDLFTIKDKSGKLYATSGKAVSNQVMLSFKKPANVIELKVIVESADDNTLWNYSISCLKDTPAHPIAVVPTATPTPTKTPIRPR